ncbi:unnamed protein product [Rangifer tarandus platyrhynchus]|uniref:Uncharacterized protein n=2 Tax=Rangifer tarandus platyrhynchus TaxID=3082113 RepID=A0ABN8YCW4_RANTA|nr:unnamed protein product [Rangifer tarandus platyrhynchus]
MRCVSISATTDMNLSERTGAWRATVPGVGKKRTQQLNKVFTRWDCVRMAGFPGGSEDKACTVGNLGREDPLEKAAVATHSSTLPWKMPWTEKSGRLQSTGVRVSMTEQLDFLSGLS